MGEFAKDVMEPRFLTVTPEQTITAAVQVFRQAAEATGERVFGLMVTDHQGKLVGMLSMYDIFLLIRPKHIHIWGEMSDLELSGIIDAACHQAGKMLVGDIMTTDLITITPDTHLLHVLDIMIKKHVRRIPVIDAGQVVGIVYISRVFNSLLEKLTGAAAACR
ncbi:MAG: CBS domain-containing protein [Deltaproteobacteria bacterium]|nr:CBS domain-containing protein [Deltaproteobacteria bacterium]